MAPTCWLCGSVGEGLRKGTMASACLSVWKKAFPQLPALMPDMSVPPCMRLVSFKLLPQCWSSEGVSLSKFICGFFNENAWDSRIFFHQLNPHWFLHPEIVGTYLPGTGTLGWGAWCGAGAPCSWDIRPEFLSTTDGCVTSPFHVSTPPPSLDGYGFFNSLVFRFPFNLISDSSEWWVFYIIAVILMWLCEEVSRVYLCLHLDWKSIFLLLWY